MLAKAVRITPWLGEMQRLIEEPHRYRWLNAAQLVKHALGLAHSLPGKQVTLLYLYWEPANAEAWPIFAEHRIEVARFAAAGGGLPEFIAMSYSELCRQWSDRADPAWLSVHVSRLVARYGVTV